MKLKCIILFFYVSLTATSLSQEWEERFDWQHFFTDAGVNGTIAVVDGRTGKYFVYDNDRSLTHFIPASTFKIPHTLFALDAGIVEDEFQIFHWDGNQRQFSSWNKDQNLRSAMSSSTVWVYQSFARELGEQREREYLGKTGYGNEDTSGGIDRFWLTGGLRISAREQIDFLQALYRYKLPFDHSHQRLVKDLIIIEAGRDWILRGKTGWAFDFDPQIGWFIGWIETADGPVFFALNIDMLEGLKDAPKREAIVRNVLRFLHTLPER